MRLQGLWSLHEPQPPVSAQVHAARALLGQRLSTPASVRASPAVSKTPRPSPPRGSTGGRRATQHAAHPCSPSPRAPNNQQPPFSSFSPTHLLHALGGRERCPQVCPQPREPGSERRLVAARRTVVPQSRGAQHAGPQLLQPTVQLLPRHVVLRVAAVAQAKHRRQPPRQPVGRQRPREQRTPQRTQRGRRLALPRRRHHPHHHRPAAQVLQRAAQRGRGLHARAPAAAQRLAADPLRNVLSRAERLHGSGDQALGLGAEVCRSALIQALQPWQAATRRQGFNQQGPCPPTFPHLGIPGDRAVQHQQPAVRHAVGGQARPMPRRQSVKKSRGGVANAVLSRFAWLCRACARCVAGTVPGWAWLCTSPPKRSPELVGGLPSPPTPMPSCRCPSPSRQAE